MNFRQVRKKIKTVNNVKKITKAMQMVAAVKMRKAQNQALEGKLYRTTLDSMLGEVLSRTDISLRSEIPLMVTNQSKKTLYILVTSNKGLCGGFNVNILKHLSKNIDLSTSEFVIVGKKGGDFARRMGLKVIADFSVGQEETDMVSAIFTVCEQNYLEGVYGCVMLVYNNFVSSFKYEPTISQLLPVAVSDNSINEVQEANLDLTDYVIEPDPATILPGLVKDVLKEKIRSSLLDSSASEHSARMMAMKQATDSATDVIASLTLLSNKLRQQSITYELLDIIGAQNV